MQQCKDKCKQHQAQVGTIVCYCCCRMMMMMISGYANVHAILQNNFQLALKKNHSQYVARYFMTFYILLSTVLLASIQTNNMKNT